MGGRSVLVAMSGGVDSSAAALILLERGFWVLGATLVFSDLHWRVAERAARVAEALGIEHLVVDARRAFEEEVVSPFVEAYLSGRTPNPCPLCNERVKFRSLLDLAEKRGVDLLATGHYCRIYPSLSGEMGLLSHPSSKDQSYVLYRLSREVLRRVVFPLGSKSKGEVRSLVASRGLPVPEDESQDLCFVEGDLACFLELRLSMRGTKVEPGPILDLEGRILGSHRGLPFYTVGQRRGLGISSARGPLYVVGMDPERNALLVGSREDASFRGCALVGLKLLEEVEPGRVYLARHRYRADPIPCAVYAVDGATGSARVEFLRPAFALTPGQHLVLYSGPLLVGGGEIHEVCSKIAEAAGIREASEGRRELDG